VNLAPSCLRINGKSVEVTLALPPIPTDRFDYAATFAGYEPGDLIGRGATPLAAVTDLKEQDDERQTDAH
jgi:hypothetical protein